MIYASDLNTRSNSDFRNRGEASSQTFCDLDELVDFIASGDGSLTVTESTMAARTAPAEQIYPSERQIPV